MARARRTPRFEIWEVADRIHSVDHPVRIKLLHALVERPRRLPDLVRLTGKAKSTLSELHVAPLLEAGLITERADPKDARSKIYELAGQRLGSSDVDVPRLRASVLAYARRANPSSLAAVLTLLSPTELVARADATYLRGLGARIAAFLRDAAGSTRPEDLVAHFDRALREAGLGRASWVDAKPVLEAEDEGVARFLRDVLQDSLAGRQARSRA